MVYAPENFVGLAFLLLLAAAWRERLDALEGITLCFAFAVAAGALAWAGERLDFLAQEARARAAARG